MKRDWDLIRDILLAAEAKPQGDMLYDSEIVGYATSDVAGHIELLRQGRYVEAHVNKGTSFIQNAEVLSITLAGYDLLDTLRSKPVWERVKSLAKEKGIELTFDAVKALAGAALKSLVP